MKARSFAIIILSIMLFLSCSINAKKKDKEVSVEKPKTPVELAIEKVNSASAAYENKDYDAAIQNFQEAIEFYNQALPTAAETDSIPLQIFKLKLNISKLHVDNAFMKTEQQQFEAALPEFTAAINILKEVKPQSTAADSIDYKINNLYLNKAICSTSAEEYSQAIENYDLYLEANPDDSDILLQKFAIYRDNLKDENKAFEVLTEYANTKNDFKAIQMLGDLYRKKGDTDNAILWYEKANAIKTNVDVLKNLSSLYKTKKSYDNSTKMLEKLVQLNPPADELKTYYKMIGGNYQNLKNKAKAVEYFEKFLSLEYDEPIAVYVVSYYYEQKNNSKMISSANLILSKNPANSDALLFRGIARYNQKDMKGAKADFEKIQNDPKHGNSAQQYLKVIK